MENRIYESVVVGGGIAGFEAALALHNFRHDFLWIGGKMFGEKLFAAEQVRNFPAFSGAGTELASLLSAQAKREELPFHLGRIDGIYASRDGFLLTEGDKAYSAHTVILATGVETKGTLPGERDFFGRGVSYCAVCDGALYRGKRVCAVLFSKEFEEEAEYLAGFAERVYAVCLYSDPAFRAKNIEVVTEPPLAVEGGERVERLLLKGRTLYADGIFFLKNSMPPAALVGGIVLEKDGHIRIGRDGSTNLSGLFAAGDVTGRPYQYVKAAGEGLVAAYSAHEFLREHSRAEKGAD